VNSKENIHWNKIELSKEDAPASCNNMNDPGRPVVRKVSQAQQKNNCIISLM
jgi:hypothetical protein